MIFSSVYWGIMHKSKFATTCFAQYNTQQQRDCPFYYLSDDLKGIALGGGTIPIQRWRQAGSKPNVLASLGWRDPFSLGLVFRYPPGEEVLVGCRGLQLMPRVLRPRSVERPS
jgi:hypothetical protein